MISHTTHPEPAFVSEKTTVKLSCCHLLQSNSIGKLYLGRQWGVFHLSIAQLTEFSATPRPDLSLLSNGQRVSFPTGDVNYFSVLEKGNRSGKLDVVLVTESKLSFVEMSSSPSPRKNHLTFNQGEGMVDSAVNLRDPELVDDLNRTGSDSLGALLVQSSSESPGLSVLKENQSEVFPDGDLLDRVVSRKRKELGSANFGSVQRLDTELVHQRGSDHEEKSLFR